MNKKLIVGIVLLLLVSHTSIVYASNNYTSDAHLFFFGLNVSNLDTRDYNGSVFTAQSQKLGGFAPNTEGVIFNQTMFIGGNNGQIASWNGTTWVNHGQKIGATTVGEVIVFNNKLYGFGLNGNYAYTANKVTWSSVVDIMTTGGIDTAQVFKNKLYVFSDSNNTYRYSEDGINWSVELSIPSITSVRTTEVFGSVMYVAGGGGKIANTTDGLVFPSPPTTILDGVTVNKCVKFGSELNCFSALGKGQFLKAGVWSAVTTVFAGNRQILDATVYDNILYVAGDTGSIAQKEGDTWSAEQTGFMSVTIYGLGIFPIEPIVNTTVCIDTTGDGQTDICFVDTNGDGVPDAGAGGALAVYRGTANVTKFGTDLGCAFGLTSCTNTNIKTNGIGLFYTMILVVFSYALLVSIHYQARKALSGSNVHLIEVMNINPILLLVMLVIDVGITFYLGWIPSEIFYTIIIIMIGLGAFGVYRHTKGG